MVDRLLYPQWRRSIRLLPARPAVVDLSHPLAPDRLYIPSLGLDDLVRGSRPFTITGSPTQTIGQAGPAYSLSSGTGFQVGTGPYLGGLPAWTVCALVQTSTATSGSGGSVYTERATSGNDIAKIHLSQITGSAVCVYRNDAGTLVNPTGGNPGVTDGYVHLMTGVFDGVNVTSYVDRTLVVTNAWGGVNNNFTDANVQQTIGYDVADATGNFAGIITAVWLYRRALSPAQIVALYNEPFAMLRPPGRPIVPSASPATNEVVTQIGAEAWLTTSPAMQLTQIGAEVWFSPTSIGTQMILTQIGSEVWRSTTSIATVHGGPIITMIN